MKKYEFSENNSGGSWWLNKKDYENLIKAGWKLPEKDTHKDFTLLDTKDIPYFWRKGMTFEAETMQEAVTSWESATGRDFFEEGCNCCGAPFSIYCGEGNSYEHMSGDSISRVPVRPW
jgi:hypothetical protein